MVKEGRAGRERLDQLLTGLGLFTSRARAQAAIMAGQVLVNGTKIDKPGTAVDPAAEIRLLGEKLPFVSRGGLKLAKALDSFQLDLRGLTVADIGASTGGFTDCALQRGAKKVYAVDVGYGQLAWSLRSDPRVCCLERINARYLEPQQLGEAVDLVTMDLSFISLTKVLPAVKKLLKPEGTIIALVKPQFEVGREQVGKKGIVREAAAQKEAVLKVMAAAEELGLNAMGLTYSPITGHDGNIEFLLHLSFAKARIDEKEAAQVVADSRRLVLKGGDSNEETAGDLSQSE